MSSVSTHNHRYFITLRYLWVTMSIISHTGSPKVILVTSTSGRITTKSIERKVKYDKTNPFPLIHVSGKTIHGISRLVNVDNYNGSLIVGSLLTQQPNSRRAVIATDLAELIRDERFGFLVRCPITFSDCLKTGSSFVLSHITASIVRLPAIWGNVSISRPIPSPFRYLFYEVIRNQRRWAKTLARPM